MGRSMKKLIVLVLSIIVLSGCKPGEEKAIELARKEISSGMKDPDSVKFRYLRFIKSGEKDGLVGGFVCGEVNAKNSYGAYAGYSKFQLALRMKSNGIFSKGATYTIDDKNIYNELKGEHLKDYYDVCGQEE